MAKAIDDYIESNTPDSILLDTCLLYTSPGSFNQQPVNQQSASNIPPSPAIIELANNSEGLTVADVAQQAARIHDINRGLPEDEVNISLH